MENLIGSRLVSPCKDCEKTGNRKICSKDCEPLEDFRRKADLLGPLVSNGRDDEGISNGRRVLPAPRYVIERY